MSDPDRYGPRPRRRRCKFTQSLIVALVLTLVGSYAHADSSWRELLTRADSLYAAKERDSSVVMGLKALGAVKLLYGDLDTNVALVFHRLGNFYREDQADSGEAYFRRALAIWEATPGCNPQHYARTLNNLAIMVGGRYSEAEAFFSKAIELKRRAIPPDEIGVATTLHNLSSLYLRIGDYARAERALQDEFNILKRIRPDGLGAYYINIANLYAKQSRYSECVNAAQEALEILTRADGGRAASIAAGNLAYGLAGLGMLDSADAVFAARVRFCDSTFEESHDGPTGEFRITYRVEAAESKRLLRQYTAAERLLEEADSLIATIPSWYEASRFRISEQYGRLHYDRARYAEAVRALQKACEYGMVERGASNPELVPSFRWLAKSYLALADPHSATVAARRATEIAYENLPVLISTVPENDALKYANEAALSASTYLESLRKLAHPSTEDMNFATQLILRTKHLTSDLLACRHRDLIHSSDTVTQHLREQRRFAAEQLAETITKHRAHNDGVSDDGRADSLQMIYQRLSNDLALRDRSASREQQSDDMIGQTLVRALPNDALGLEYYAFGSDNPAEGTNYALVAIESVGTRLVWLSTPGRIDSLVVEYVSHMSAIAEQDHPPTQTQVENYREIAAKLYGEIIGPAASLLDGKSALFISPAGMLNRLAFSGLWDNNNQYLIESFRIDYLDAIRELALSTIRESTGSGVLGFADPDFDKPTDTSSASFSETGPGIDHMRDYSPIRGRCSTHLDSLLVPLPNSRLEIEQIKQIFLSRHDTIDVFLGERATEEHFKQYASGSRVLHLATHGFYLRQDCESSRPRTPVSAQRLAFMNPFLVSGLLLAGARQSILNPDEVSGEDGILSALEVTELDLTGVQLVTLSACESGLGVLQETEGMYGLRRAFAFAGAEAVLSSLWPVSDEATTILMPEIYRRWSFSISQACNAAQLNHIASLRQSGLADHPFLWAAFVLFGGR